MPHPSEIAQHAGAAVAIGSGAIGIPGGIMGWLNTNSTGILAICGIIGAICTVWGRLENRKHLSRERIDRRYGQDRRQGERRSGCDTAEGSD